MWKSLQRHSEKSNFNCAFSFVNNFIIITTASGIHTVYYTASIHNLIFMSDDSALHQQINHGMNNLEFDFIECRVRRKQFDYYFWATFVWSRKIVDDFSFAYFRFLLNLFTVRFARVTAGVEVITNSSCWIRIQLRL